MANKHNISAGGVKKFVPKLSNKNKHVIHYRNLQLYIQLEMRLTKIHRVLNLHNLKNIHRF